MKQKTLFLIIASLCSSAFAAGQPIYPRFLPGRAPAPAVAPAVAPVVQPANSPGAQNLQQQNLDARYRDTGISTHSTPGLKPKPDPQVRR